MKRSPGDFVYLWNLSGVQKRVGHAGEGSADIKCDGDGLFLAVVGLSNGPWLVHGGGDGGEGER